MRLSTHLASIALLATTACAQVVSYATGSYGISVNVPANTASSGSGPIYFQINAPSGTQWVGFGQGSGMEGANMFLVYAQSSSNVTLSPRLGTGEVMPQFNGNAQVTLLAGSGIASDGSMVANVRCDSCLSWSGGSMNPTSSSSNWIWAHKSGSALDTSNPSAQIQQHNTMGTFNLDLTQGTGGNSGNPFVAASQPSSSSGPSSSSASQSGTRSATNTATQSSVSSTAAASGTNSVSQPVATSSPNTNSGSTSSTSNTATLVLAHGAIMSVLFLGLFPLASLTLYLPTAIKVRFIHAPLQGLGTILVIVGMALGVTLANRLSLICHAHAILGLIVVVIMVVFQPAMGIFQHLHYGKTGGRSIFGQIHRWLGRTLLILGVINGGLGWQLSGNSSGYAPYAAVAVVVFLLYLAVLFWAWRKGGKTAEVDGEKIAANRGFEMHRPRAVGHSRLGSNEVGGSAYVDQKNNRF